MTNKLDLNAPKPAGMTDLEHFKSLGAKLNQLRSVSKAVGKIEYIGIDGKLKTEYWNGRWTDRPANIRDYQKNVK